MWNYNLICTSVVASLQSSEVFARNFSAIKFYHSRALIEVLIWTKRVFSKRLYIIWEVLYSITWIPWRSILVNINFHVIQFSLISLIFAFFSFSPKQFLKKLSKSYWFVLYRLVNFDIHYQEKLHREELFVR